MDGWVGGQIRKREEGRLVHKELSAKMMMITVMPVVMMMMVMKMTDDGEMLANASIALTVCQALF